MHNILFGCLVHLFILVSVYHVRKLMAAFLIDYRQFESAPDVLNGVRHLVAMQLAHDPVVRKCVRTAYRERAVIKVHPTKKGIKEIDENHQCYSMKYIINKPITDLKNEQYLKLHLVSFIVWYWNLDVEYQ